MNTTAVGRAFEKEIADLYTLMGYAVSHNLNIDGQQIDIVVSMDICGSGTFRQIVECKFNSANGTVGNDDVQSIAGAYIISKVKRQIAGCVIVTNTDFSVNAKEAATSAGIILKTRDQLINELVDFKPYLKKLLNNFNSSFGTGEESWYIQTKIETNNQPTEYLSDYVDQWLLKKDKSPLAIKGGYGTGKSSFCLYY